MSNNAMEAKVRELVELKKMAAELSDEKTDAGEKANVDTEFRFHIEPPLCIEKDAVILHHFGDFVKGPEKSGRTAPRTKTRSPK